MISSLLLSQGVNFEGVRMLKAPKVDVVRNYKCLERKFEVSKRESILVENSLAKYNFAPHDIFAEVTRRAKSINNSSLSITRKELLETSMIFYFAPVHGKMVSKDTVSKLLDRWEAVPNWDRTEYRWILYVHEPYFPSSKLIRHFK